MLQELAFHATLAAIAYGLHEVMKGSSANKLESLHLDAMSVRFLSSCCKIFAIYNVGMGACHAAGIQVGDLSTSLITSGSFVVGLASKNVLENAAAGIMLIYTRPFQVGDKVKVAGVSGKIVSVGFFQTKIVDGENEGHILPNSAVNGALRSLMSSFDNSSHQLRKAATTLTFPVAEDLEKVFATLEKILPDIDKHLEDVCKDKKVKAYATGNHTIADYYQDRYGRNLLEDQKKHSAALECKGQDPGSGFVFEISTFCEITVAKAVTSYMFRAAVKACRADGVKLFGPGS